MDEEEIHSTFDSPMFKFIIDVKQCPLDEFKDKFEAYTRYKLIGIQNSLELKDFLNKYYPKIWIIQETHETMMVISVQYQKTSLEGVKNCYSLITLSIFDESTVRELKRMIKENAHSFFGFHSFQIFHIDVQNTIIIIIALFKELKPIVDKINQNLNEKLKLKIQRVDIAYASIDNRQYDDIVFNRRLFNDEIYYYNQLVSRGTFSKNKLFKSIAEHMATDFESSICQGMETLLGHYIAPEIANVISGYLDIKNGKILFSNMSDDAKYNILKRVLSRENDTPDSVLDKIHLLAFALSCSLDQNYIPANFLDFYNDKVWGVKEGSDGKGSDNDMDPYLLNPSTKRYDY